MEVLKHASIHMPGFDSLALADCHVCHAGPDFLWRIDKIEVDNTSLRQIKVMLHSKPCMTKGVTCYCVPGYKPVPVHIFFCVCLSTLPAADEPDAMQALDTWGESVSFQDFEKALAQGEKAWTPLSRADVTAKFMQVSFPCVQRHRLAALPMLAIGNVEILPQQGWQCTAGTCTTGTVRAWHWQLSAGRSPECHMRTVEHAFSVDAM